jgi:hypothetical protein
MSRVAFAGVTTTVNDYGLSTKPGAARVMIKSAISTLVAIANTGSFALTDAASGMLTSDG